MNEPPILLIALATLTGLSVLLVPFVLRLLITVPPNRLLVVSGGQRRSADGSIVGYRMVWSGRTLRIPILERADWLDLSNIMADATIHNAVSRDGVPLDIDAVAAIKVATSEPEVHRAVERFLGRSRQEIQVIAQQTLTGNLRQAIATLPANQVLGDSDALTHAVMQTSDFDQLGLRLDAMKVRHARLHANTPNAGDEPPREDDQPQPACSELPPELLPLQHASVPGREKEVLVESLAERTFRLIVIAERSEASTSFDLPDEYRGGRTLLGRVGDATPIAVSFVKDRTEEVAAVEPGTDVCVALRLLKYEPLFNRLRAMAIADD